MFRNFVGIFWLRRSSIFQSKKFQINWIDDCGEIDPRWSLPKEGIVYFVNSFL